MANSTQKPKTTLQEQKNSLNHILIIKGLYCELDEKRIGAQQAAEALRAMDILRKESIKGGVYYELKERESK